MKYLDILLKVRTKERTSIQIIFWWELRRIRYNLIVLICGFLSWSIMYALVKLLPGEDLQEPIFIIAFVFLCNVCYTLGWLTEIFMVKSQSYAPDMFKFGLYFTLFWVFLPACLHIIFWPLKFFIG